MLHERKVARRLRIKINCLASLSLQAAVVVSLAGCLSIPLSPERPGFYGVGAESASARYERLVREREAELRPRFPVEAAGAAQVPRFPAQVLNHGVGETAGNFSESENTWRLNSVMQSPRNSEGIAYLPWTLGKGDDKWARTLRCHYGQNEGNYRALLFWHKVRPAVDATVPIDQVYTGDVRKVTADIAVSECPATWGEALAFVWGSDAWDVLARSPGAVNSRLVAKLESDRNRELLLRHQREMEASYERLSERGKCLRRNGLVEPGSERGAKSALYSSWVQVFCGKHKD